MLCAQYRWQPCSLQTVTDEHEPWLCTILRWISRWNGPPAVVRSSPLQTAHCTGVSSNVCAQIVNTSFNDRGKPILRALSCSGALSTASLCRSDGCNVMARMTFGTGTARHCVGTVFAPVDVYKLSRRTGCGAV